jgi:hypothetical protein
MATILLPGIGAGLVSALLIAVVAKATPLALLLFLLAPIPVLIVTLGWQHRSGLIATATGGVATALVLSPLEGIGFAIGTGLPAWWLGYLALLGRPQPDGSVEWYPLGRLLAWIAATAALTVLATAVVSSGDYAAFEQRMRRLAEGFVQVQLRASRGTALPVPDSDQVSQFAERLAAIAPMLAAQGFTLILASYVWVAAKIVAVSGRLPRPWPYIPGTVMPRSTLITLAGAVLFANLSGFAGVFGLTLLGATLMAFGLQGLAALHHLTAGRKGRGALLAIAYVLLALSQGLLFLALILFGIADTAFGLRQRMNFPRPPSGAKT